MLTPRMSYFFFNFKEYKRIIHEDEEYNTLFYNGELPKYYHNSYEWRYIKTYRKFQCNHDNLWGKIYQFKIKRLEYKTGICFGGNTSIGDGLIIGHWGKIVINKDVKFGNHIFLTHGVTIGRDIRGERAGVPTIGDKVCIRTNSTIVGKVKIGTDVLIAPNTFVNFDVPDHSIVIGNPATIHHRENATEGHLPTRRY